MNTDGSPLKKGKRFTFEMNSTDNINFFVTILDEENVLIKQEFTKDFSNGKDVYLYIREDENGEVYLEEDTSEIVQDSIDKLFNFINRILK